MLYFDHAMFPQAHVLNTWSVAGGSLPSDSGNSKKWSLLEKDVALSVPSMLYLVPKPSPSYFLPNLRQKSFYQTHSCHLILYLITKGQATLA